MESSPKRGELEGGVVGKGAGRRKGKAGEGKRNGNGRV